MPRGACQPGYPLLISLVTNHVQCTSWESKKAMHREPAQRRLRPRQALFNQNEKAKFMYIVTSGSMMLSERKFHASSDATNIAERHEIEECPPLTLIGIKHAFETRTIARFEYDCTALEEGATLMAIPKETIITLYNEKALRSSSFASVITGGSPQTTRLAQSATRTHAERSTALPRAPTDSVLQTCRRV